MPRLRVSAPFRGRELLETQQPKGTEDAAMSEPLIDSEAPRFGLADSLLVPIAACDLESIETFVGEVERIKRGRGGRIQALAIRPHSRRAQASESLPIWSHPARAEFERRLFPARQIWVHVDYGAYRKAYLELDGQEIPAGYFLDHVQNREAMHLRGNSHPFLRLCPVSRAVNTSGGHDAGGEGMEKAFLRERAGDETFRRQLSSYRIIYADPMDLCKMLDRPPGTGNLDGVRVTQALFYPT